MFNHKKKSIQVVKIFFKKPKLFNVTGQTTNQPHEQCAMHN